jgi:hypothetical protein
MFCNSGLILHLQVENIFGVRSIIFLIKEGSYKSYFFKRSLFLKHSGPYNEWCSWSPPQRYLNSPRYNA